MMKIEKLLIISEKLKDGKKKEMGRVQDLSDDELKNLNKKKFKRGKSQRGMERLEANCFVILREDFEDYEREYDFQIQSLEKTISDHEETIKNLQNRLSSIDEEHKTELKEKENEYSGKVDELKADIQIKDIEIERMKTECEKEKGDIKADYERQIGEFKEGIQKQINELELFDEESHISIIKHQEEISKLNLFNPEYHMKKEDHQKALNKMRGNCLKLRVRENKEYSSYIDELENLGIIDKLRNKDKPILKALKGLNSEAIDDNAIDVNFNLIDENNEENDG